MALSTTTARTKTTTPLPESKFFSFIGGLETVGADQRQPLLWDSA